MTTLPDPIETSAPAALPGSDPRQPGRTATLTAKAHCRGCEWTAGPGTPAETDRKAEKHVRVGHSVTVVSWNPAREAA